ncbi:MAG: hypothetical protein UMV23_02100 [Halanaerobium sp.]|nr:hypothetical protein [Halanaerobium sp.]
MADLQSGPFLAEDKEFSRGINLLISILLLYPDINFVKMDYNKKSLHFSFMLKGLLTEKNRDSLSHQLTTSLKFLKQLHSSELKGFNLNFHRHDKQFTQVELVRDLTNLDARELAMVVGFFQQHFPGKLLSESNGGLDEEEIIRQEEQIDKCISDLRVVPETEDLIGFR